LYYSNKTSESHKLDQIVDDAIALLEAGLAQHPSSIFGMLDALVPVTKIIPVNNLRYLVQGGYN
jgi:hypothetical protein